MLHRERVFANVNLDNISYNIRQIRKHLPKRTKIMAVIKADGYGHGAVRIAQELSTVDSIWGYAVATIDEALEIIEQGIGKPVLILGYSFPLTIPLAVEYGIRVTLFDMESAKLLSETAKRFHKKAHVHIKLDTGMGRIGITPDEAGLAFVKEVSTLAGIEIEGVFTHFARADERDKTAANEQFAKYRHFLELLEREGIHIPLKHCANSAGIMEFPDTHLDLVRSGIITYGLLPSDEVDPLQIRLRPAMEIKSSVIYVKTVPAGTPISYGGTFRTERESRIATVSVGYADGYPRCLSGKGQVLIRGQRFPVVGRVCMDQMMIDVTDAKTEVAVGDTVTLVGRDGDEMITMDDFAALSGRINYEAVCDIGKRVPRNYIRNDENAE
ncbi:MAG: alanine racemase [Lachnospiraceae bacterium]|nr:alanine racemase [Lachnospiraceae bacterium]